MKKNTYKKPQGNTASVVKKVVSKLFFLGVILFAGLIFWARQPILTARQTAMEFSIQPGSGASSVAQQITRAGVPLHPLLFTLMVRASLQSSQLKAGSYVLQPGITPWQLMGQLTRGEYAQESLVVIEGWRFSQMRAAIAAHSGLKHDTAGMTDQEILRQIYLANSNSDMDYSTKAAEGLFFPDTFLFAKGSSDLQIYQQSHAALLKRLHAAWSKRDPSLPYKTPYEALIMASIIEKETGQASERPMIAAVFINRLKKGMLLQTDPTVIYGMGEHYQGNIRKRDLLTDTPHNTYTRVGLPPTPIALPGQASLDAAFNPAKTDALYFVARGDGTSQFSSNLNDHNRAVNRFQRGG